MPGRLLRVGLTGGIASGKSHVLRRLAAAGFATIDLDRVAHALMQPGGPATAEVAREFGPAVLDPTGAVDRKALGAIVFGSAAARARLDAIVHPLVRAREAEAARAAEEAGAPLLVTDAALLVEAGMHLRFDRLLVTWCAPQEQMARLHARDGLDQEAARARIAAQMPGGEKRAFAHVVIDTSGTVSDTDAQVAELVPALAGLAPPPPLPGAADLLRAVLERGPSAGPRGLGPWRLAAEFAAAAGFDLARLAGALDPPAAGPWYRAARPGQGGPGPEALAAVLAACCGQRGADAPFVEGAGYALARLTHAEGEAHSAGCVAARAAWAVASRRALAVLDEDALATWSAQARARCGSDPPAAVLDELRSAAAGRATPGALSAALAALAGTA